MAIPIAATYSQMTMKFEVSHHTINFAVKRGYAQPFGVPEAMLSRLECQRLCSADWSARGYAQPFGVPDSNTHN